MGAWGINAFENDGAMDWVCEFLDEPTDEKLREVFTPQVYPQRQGLMGLIGRFFGARPAASEPELCGDAVVAAAEVVATLRGRPSASLPEDFADLPKIAISDETVSLGIKAIDSILQFSNAQASWSETDSYESWISIVKEIRERLTTA